MAIPRVFVSSTCYDLKYIRENLKYFIKTLGYDPVLSEEGSVFYDPKLDTQDSCLGEIPSCQMFVLIIGGRFGTTYKDTEDSITNNEYREAVKSKIPVFALVENPVLTELSSYQKHKENKKVNEKEIDYAFVDSPKIFEFITEVRSNSVNNALNPFSDFSDIESYLKQQWAGMMYSFLTRQNEERRVSDTLSTLTQMSEKLEFLSTQILRSVGTEEAKILTECYDLMIGYQCFRDLAYWGLKPTPKDILTNNNFKDCAKSLGQDPIIKKEWRGMTISGHGEISENKFKVEIEEYIELQSKISEILKNHNISLEEFLNFEGRSGG